MANTSEIMESREGGQWFSIYKPTQGYWTRVLTAIGGAALVLWGAQWLLMRLEGLQGSTVQQVIRFGVPLVWIIGLGLAMYWAIGRSPRVIDFFISVEGEMKKVNWSSRQEVIGATKVVLLFVVLFSLMLAAVDVVFKEFFSLIGVLKF
jgi:preprotein translocase SecE subunit